MNDLTQAEYTRLKGRLTKAQNKLKKVAEPADKQRAAAAIVCECDDAMRIFEEKGYPDSWHNWERAKDDATFLLQRLLHATL